MQKHTAARVYNRLYSAFTVRKNERIYTSSGGAKLRYMFFEEKKSNVLVIGFQAFSDGEACYNYVYTIKNMGVNRLYIKDDFAENHMGNYCIGLDGECAVEPAVYELIDQYIQKCMPDKLVFIGSSKGGYSAVNFGLHYRCSRMIVAAPQYYIGTFLDSDKYYVNLENIIGSDFDVDAIRKLDLRLKEKIKKDEWADTQKIYIHYSARESTYRKHVMDFLKDISNRKIALEEEVADYRKHSDLRYYFPSYLIKCLEKIMEE